VSVVISPEHPLDLDYTLFMWGGGVLSTISTYDPYAHAQNHHELFFTYAKKFSRNSPTLIVSVVFPWFSEQVTSNVGASEIFYRSLCRRFFCQYANDARPASSKLKNIWAAKPMPK
jgi:hypothetical protein